MMKRGKHTTRPNPTQTENQKHYIEPARAFTLRFLTEPLNKPLQGDQKPSFPTIRNQPSNTVKRFKQSPVIPVTQFPLSAVTPSSWRRHRYFFRTCPNRFISVTPLILF
ncbi:hypothetical protein E2542_SST26119 [Spatholobus suberectus]|nr:hypothetical protein E2542_SST26119 [Spatholobus suberectus]